MLRLARPWALRQIPSERSFGPDDCLLSEADGPPPRDLEHAVLMRGEAQGRRRMLLLHPYPRGRIAKGPDRMGFPVRPRSGAEPRDDQEREAQEALRRMNEVLARIQELEEALDDPSRLWSRLAEAWARAEDEADPRMAEIVLQARETQPHLRELEHRIRRVLRRTRERTPLDRAQEIDRASMLWLVRQPGRTVAERAGPQQRILATVRRENFDTLENRVLHAYARLAATVAREWLREHPRARSSRRYIEVEAYRARCRRFAGALSDLGVGIAEPGATPNYVLMQDRGYRTVHRSWKRLLERERAIDDLWAWQAETWTDFAVLALVLALNRLDDAELVAQSPIAWRAEAVCGHWFDQDRPLAVFWLRRANRIVEVQSRPENPGPLQTLSRAHVALRVTGIDQSEPPRRVAIWTPHAIRRLDIATDAKAAAELLGQMQRVPSYEILRDGLILTPGHDQPSFVIERTGSVSVTAIAFDASGGSLAEGTRHLVDSIRRLVGT